MRISRHQMYMEMARTASKRSTCHRLNVGAIIVLGKKPGIVALGYNGPAEDAEHCKGNDCPLSASGGCTRARHAEWNAIDRMHPDYRGCEGLTIYCTHSPCPHCAEHIINAGIQVVYYEVPYRDTSSVDLMLSKGIQVFRYSPSGYLLSHRDNKVYGLE